MINDLRTDVKNNKPAFINVREADIALKRIVKVVVRQFRFNELESGKRYASDGHITISLSHDETLSFFCEEGYSLLCSLLDIYGLEDRSSEFWEWTIYP